MNKNLFYLRNTKNIYQQLFLLFILFLSGNVWSQITITQASSGITATGYDSGTERTWTQNGVSFGAKALFKESGQARLQLQANNGVIYNTTALPGRIIGLSITQNGTARNYNLTGGTSRLVTSTSGDYAVSGTAIGVAGTSWASSSFNSTNYTFFAIKLAVNNVSYVTSVVITYEESCPAPTSPTTTTAITSSSATLGWAAPTSPPANGYDYYLSTSSTAPDAATTPTANVPSGTSANVSVSANTTYNWWVRSNCSASDKSSWVSGGSFTTPQLAATFPYSENFEGTNGNNWTFVNGSQTNKWFVGSAVNNGGTQSLYISNNASGTTHNYLITSTSVVQSYRDITIPAGTTTANISFDWRANGEGSSTKFDYLSVWMVPVTFTPTAGSVITTVPSRIKVGDFNLVNSWGSYTNNAVDVSSFAGQTMRLVFEWQNDNSGGTQAPAAIDNLAVTLPAASTTVTPTSLTGFTATRVTDSPQQSFVVSGNTLGSDNITITPSAGYEISQTSGSGYSSTPIVLTPTSGTVANTTIYVVLKKSATTGAANGTVTVSTPAVTPNKTVTLTGTVTKATFTSVTTGNWETAATWDLNAVPGATDNVVIATGHTVTATTGQTRDTGTTTLVTGTLATNASYSNNGTTTINGTFQINAGGFGGGANDFVYGAAGNLIFNHNNGNEYGSIDGGHKYWPASGPFNVTINSNSPINLGVTRTVAGTLQVAAGFRNLGNITIGTNGTLRLNAGYSWLNVNSSPVYGTASKLIYNSGGSPGRSNEWTASAGTVGTTAGLPQDVQVSNNTTINFPNGSTNNFRANGVLTIDSGSSLYQNYSGGSAGLIVGGNLVLNGNLGLGSNEGGDVTVGGNWTQAATANFYPNGRKAIFNGTIAQTIQKVGGGAIDFDRLEINKTNATNVAVSNSTGNLTDININGTSSNVFSITGSGAGSLNLQNRVLTFNNNGGFIYVDAAKAITATTGAIINVNGSKAVANNAGTGALSFPAQVTINLNQNAVFDFGKSAAYISTVNGVLNINHANAYVNVNPPIYGASSKLVYKSGGTYARKIEWSTTTGAGYPFDVQVTNNTTLDYPNTGSAAFTTALGVSNDLTIDSGSSLYMSYGDNGNKSGSLTVGRNIVNSGNFSLGNAFGGDLNLGGNWTSTGTFIPNDRAVAFVGTNGSDQTINGATTFDYLTVNKTGLGSVTLAASVIVNKNLTLTNKSIVLGNFNLTLPNKTSVITSNANSYVAIVSPTTGKLIRQNVDSSSDWVFPVGVAASGRYAPITIKNLSGTTDLSVNASTAISPTVADATRVLSTKWFVTTNNNVTANIYAEWQGVAAETNSMTIPATGSLATTVGGAPYTFYNVNLVANNTTATGVALSNAAANGIVIGNDNAISLPNDECSGAVSIVVDAVAVSGSNKGATSSSGFAAAPCSSGSNSRDVWYKFTTTDQGTYKINVFKSAATGAMSDPVLDLRSGTCAASVNIGCSDGSGDEIITLSLNANTTYYYRVYNFGSSTGDGLFTTSVTTVPSIIVTPATLAYGNVTFNTTSDKTVTVKGSFLNPANDNITVAALAGYEYSLDGVSYSSTLTLPYTSKTLAETTVHVRFKPTTACTDYNGNIAVSGGGATTVNIAVTGRGSVLANSGTDISANTFTANWNAVSGATAYKIDVYKKTVNPNATDLFISEYVEGSSNNKYIEIFNGTGADVDLSNYSLQLFSNGNSAADSNVVLSGILQNNSAKVYKNASAAITLPSGVVAENNAAVNFNGDDALALYKISTAAKIDIFGRIGDDPGAAWTGAGGYTTLDKTLRRKSSILSGVSTSPTGTGALAFTTLTTEWDLFNIDVVSGLGTHTFDGGVKYTYVVQNQDVGNVTFHTVTGLDPNTEYFYVVRAVFATCESANSNEIPMTTNNTIIWNNNTWTNTTGPDATLDAIIRTPYYVKASTDEFSVRNLTIESTGLLKIKSGHGITVAGDITTPNDKIIIESDASLTQTKLTNGNSDNKVIAKRNVKMKTLDYTYWSSPVKDQVLLNTSNINATNSSGGFSPGTPNNRTYEYNEVNDKFRGTTDATFVPAKGYAIRGKAGYGTTLTVDSLAFSGNLHNGDYSIQIQKSKDSSVNSVTYDHGYNLIGNPYPSNINFIKLFNLAQGNGVKNSDLIEGKAWFYTNFSASGTQAGSSYGGNNYATITLAGGTSPTSLDSATGTPTPNEFIKVAQGFIVRMKGAAPLGSIPNTAILKFDNSVRTNNSTGHFYNNNKNIGDEINRYWLKIVSPYDIANTVLIAHMDGATNEYDPDYDAELLTVGDDSFYSKINAQKMQIQARANPFAVDDVIALGTKYAMNGTYRIALVAKEGIFATDQKIYLRDKSTNIYTDLTAKDYSFDAAKGLDESRFEIVYKNNEVLGTDNAGKSDFVVYRDGDSFVVKSSRILGKIELYDVTGKLIQSKNMLSKECRFDSSAMISGVYIIKAENSGDIRRKKIIK